MATTKAGDPIKMASVNGLRTKVSSVRRVRTPHWVSPLAAGRLRTGHNVQIGAHTVIAAQTGISGSCTIGHHAIIGGQVGMGDHSYIEGGAIVGAQAGIPTGKIIRSGQTVWGTPARDLDKFKEAYAWQAKLPQLAARIKKLEETVND